MQIAYNEYMKSEEWRQRAEAAKARVGQRCQICNRPAPRVTLTVHHRTFERLGQEQPEDLTVLCRGCYELYEKNRRMPTAPSVQPDSSTAKPDQTVQSRKPPSSTPASPLFIPARENQHRTTLNDHNGHNDSNGHPGHTAQSLLLGPTNQIYLLAPDVLSLEDADIYDLSPAAAGSPTAAIYHLAKTPPNKPTAAPAALPARPRRGRWMALVTLVGLVLLLLFGLSDFMPTFPALAPSLVSIKLANPTVVTMPTASTASVVRLDATPGASQVAAPATPTLAPTWTPMPTPVPPTPTVVPPTVAPTSTSASPTVAPTPASTAALTPASKVVRTALVCRNPCSCSPIVKTIPQGTAVTLLQTQACGGDTWYQIGENEWLGPGLIETK